MYRISPYFLALLFLITLKFTLAHRDFFHYFLKTYQNHIFLSVVFNLVFYHYVIKITLFKTLYQDTIQKVDKHIASLYYILLVGAIGTRKSANLTAFAQMCEMSKLRNMHDKHETIRILLTNIIHFKDFHTYIHKNFDPNIVHTDQKYRYFVYKYYKSTGKPILHLTKIIQDAPFRTPRLIDLLAEYLEIIYYLDYRKIHILSNTTIESINTGFNSYPVQESFFQLYRPNNLAHEKYLVIVEDEKGVVDNARVYARMDKENVKANDDGKDIHAMLQRHGSKGTNTTLVVSQSEKDVTANRRRLPNRFVEFLNPKDIQIFNIELGLINFFINKLKRKEEKFYKRKMRKIRKYLL